MSHRKYTVKQGDCISSIAYRHGLFPESIWTDPENSELKQKRKDPSVLLPGDVVFVREKEIEEASCVSDEKHRFMRKGVPERLRIQFMDEEEKARANEAYTLDIDGALSNEKTDADGNVEIWIPPDSKKAKITFPDSGEEYELDLGDLDPVTQIKGVQARLSNLGFYDGDIDGNMNEDLENAIRDFQEKNSLDTTGKLTESFIHKLDKVYGK